MAVRLIDALATTEAMADVFSDASVLQAMLDFEVALARAEARVGVIPQRAARIIAAAAQPANFNIERLAYEVLRAGTPGIPVARLLAETASKQDAAAAGFVHWGATSQDLADTALMLLLKKARPILMDGLVRVESGLARLSEKQKSALMLGRTLLQAAPPVTFGLKAATWLSAITYGREQLSSAFNDALLLQFGGASGTLASLGDNGPAVAERMAAILGLRLPEAPWHTRRERLASLICACGVITGSLAKMARDIALLTQGEIGEAAEPGGKGRGGSSTMPQKRNPIACSLALASAARVPGLVGSFLSAMVQEHERGVGGWQAEWPIVSSVIQATALAAESMAEVAEGVSVYKKKMRINIAATNGAAFAERASMLLAEKLGKSAAHELVREASEKSAKEGRRLSEVLAEIPEAAGYMGSTILRELEAPEKYLGSAEEFRKALLFSAGKQMPSKRRTNVVRASGRARTMRRNTKER